MAKDQLTVKIEGQLERDLNALAQFNERAVAAQVRFMMQDYIRRNPDELALARSECRLPAGVSHERTEIPSEGRSAEG